MINLRECKFGDRLRTRDGRLAIFLHCTYYGHLCYLAVAKDRQRNDYYFATYRKTNPFWDFSYKNQNPSEKYHGDIVGIWEDNKDVLFFNGQPIVEEENKN